MKLKLILLMPLEINNVRIAKGLAQSRSPVESPSMKHLQAIKELCERNEGYQIACKSST